jgi:hypothetical protein
MLFTLAENYHKPIQKLCLQSLIRHNPEAKIFTKSTIQTLKGGEQFLAEYNQLNDVHFSDIFRMWYIHNFGGAWIDADCIHLRKMEHPDTEKLTITYSDSERHNITQMYTYAKEPENRFLSMLLNRQKKLVEDKTPQSLAYLDLGEWGINYIRAHHDGDKLLNILPHWEHSYIPWHKSKYFHVNKYWGGFQFDRGLYNPNAYCYHLTNRIIHEFGHMTENQLFNNSSFLSFLLNRSVKNGFSDSKEYGILKRLPDVQGKYTYCEVGVYRGQNVAIIGQQRCNSYIIGVDPWSSANVTEDYRATKDYIAYDSNDTHEANYKQTLENVWFLQSQKRIDLYRKTSEEASKQIPNRSIDLVFIDGDHSYSGCKKDIECWLPKVKLGGWIGGHDYKHPNFNSQVHLAVDELFPNIELDSDYSWFVKVR